ncbi:helix-turn-helix domain-containing protein [Noviherbaspirillum sp. DKR-6]|uniref:Helix-turn-helix domain-containing protein n=1 Tax=Noviherbaspirillum pedocola TaxID=2801341 RepID=A0A934T1A3_9BURK|nr:helix-turn-helix domain-containing protein [Noviherbaspirillum pedocola]
MSEFRLTRAQERQQAETPRRTHDVRQYRRSLAVLECGRGKPVNEVAAVLHVTRQSIHNWATRYRRAGQSQLWQIASIADGHAARTARWTPSARIAADTAGTVRVPRHALDGALAPGPVAPASEPGILRCDG